MILAGYRQCVTYVGVARLDDKELRFGWDLGPVKAVEVLRGS